MVANVPEEWRWSGTHGQRLREARIKKGVSQKKAAAILGVSDDTLRNWESGATQPREEFLLAIAEFCDLPLAELVRLHQPALPTASPPTVEETRPARAAGTRTRRAALLATILVLTTSAALAVSFWRRANQFREIRASDNGIEAISRSGRVLWRATGIQETVAERWKLTRVADGRTLIACVLARRGDHRPEAVSTLSFIEPNAKRLEVVRTVGLPSNGWTFFPEYSRRYELAYINALDLDGDGIDEILATYQQVPECVSYTVLYEPAIGRARIVFVQTGAHHFTGAWDLDGDGQRELVFLGINNGYNWMNAIAAIRLVSPIGTPLRPDDNHPVTSPDSGAYLPRESALVFYTLLPRGGVPDDSAAVSWDASRRVISVRLLNGRVVTLTARGFLAGSRSARPEVERDVLRRQAFRHNREGRRLTRAGFGADAIRECRKAIRAAEQSGDEILLEAMQRDLAKVLIRAGHAREGEALANQLAAKSENVSEIFYDAALAFHLTGNLREAVAYYDAGIRRGGSPEEGKSKHEFMQGQVLALIELGAFTEAEQAVDRFRERYISGADDWTARYREFIRWRKGDLPDPRRMAVPPNATDLERYWVLEFQNANGRDAPSLLRSVDALLAEHNEPRAALRSLRAVLLERLGRQGEAETAIGEARRESDREANSSIIARGHVQIIAARYASLGR